MTGHTVLSTPRTNNAPSTPVRLLDKGVPGYMIASTLRAGVAQRLVRAQAGKRTLAYCTAMRVLAGSTTAAEAMTIAE